MNDRETRFMGRITAATTHEIRNVLAIVRESAGLIQDIIGMAKEPLPHQDKFVKSLKNIQDQVNRGVDLSTRLNQFAHSMDQEIGPVNLNEFAAYMACLLGRFARLKKVNLDTLPDPQAPSATTDLFRLQMIVTEMIDAVLQQAQAGQTIWLKTEAGAQGPALSVMVETPGELSIPEEGIEETCRRLGLSMACLAQEKASGLTLKWPA